MKKSVKVVVLMLAALVLGYYGYTAYQNSSSLKGVVHQDAVSVVKIGIHDIKKTLMLDALSAPSYYYKNSGSSRSKAKDDNKASTGKGVELMPHNLLFFTMPDVGNTLFTVFKIYDSNDFQTFINNEIAGKVRTDKNDGPEGYQLAFFKNRNIALAWNSEKLAVALAPKIENQSVVHVFEELLVGEKTISDTNHPLLSAIKSLEAHVVYTNGKGVSGLTFEDGSAVLKGAHQADSPFAKEITVPSYANSSLSFHYDLNLTEASIKEEFAKRLSNLPFFGKNNLDPSKIIQPLDGSLSFSIAGRTVQKDTAITYGYDDNFEKIAQKTVQEKEVPVLHLDLGLQEQKLQHYFSEVGALSENGIFEPFPLYQLKLVEQSSRAGFSTEHDTIVPQQKVSSYFFNVQTDFQRLQQDLAIAQTQELFSVLYNMRVQAWQEAENEIQVEGNINAVEDHINILSQVFFALNKKEDPAAKEPEL
ncbi:hypothetical protein [uncultured Croceitalea sp.]|uniref:hypothetical protein n=1 Tax=uncultured Croceitalea sp. TaxID=1798908 RepID=UPI003305C433